MPYLYSMRLSVRNLFFFWYMIPNEDIIDFFIVINLLCSKIHGCVSGTCMHTTIHLLLCTIINYACNSKQLQVCVNHCTDRKSLVQISLVAELLFLFFCFTPWPCIVYSALPQIMRRYFNASFGGSVKPLVPV